MNSTRIVKLYVGRAGGKTEHWECRIYSDRFVIRSGIAGTQSQKIEYSSKDPNGEGERMILLKIREGYNLNSDAPPSAVEMQPKRIMRLRANGSAGRTKDWECHIYNDWCMVKFGRTGSKLQEQEYLTYAPTAFANKKSRRKMAEGYWLISNEAPSREVIAPQSAPSVPPNLSKVCPALEKWLAEPCADWAF